jgi:hypothetical protein
MRQPSSSGLGAWIGAHRDRRYHWRAIRLRLARRLLRFWPLWLFLLFVNLAESPIRHRLHGDSLVLAWWNHLDLLGLGVAGAAGLAIWTGLAMKAYLKTSSRPPRNTPAPSQSVTSSAL